jgi:hypothetical protein
MSTNRRPATRPGASRAVNLNHWAYHPNRALCPIPVGSKRMKPHGMGFTIFISIFFLVGFGLLGYGVHSFYRGRQALSWPTVEGRLLECRLHENPDSDGTTWEVKVRYSYSVAGGEFEGKRVAFGYSGSSTHEEHQGIYEKLKSASRVMVRYQPSNPGSSVLAAGFNRSTFLILAFAVTWLLFTTGFTVLATSSSGRDTRILEQIQIVK